MTCVWYYFKSVFLFNIFFVLINSFLFHFMYYGIFQQLGFPNCLFACCCSSSSPASIFFNLHKLWIFFLNHILNTLGTCRSNYYDFYVVVVHCCFGFCSSTRYYRRLFFSGKWSWLEMNGVGVAGAGSSGGCWWWIFLMAAKVRIECETLMISGLSLGFGDSGRADVVNCLNGTSDEVDDAARKNWRCEFFTFCWVTVMCGSM